MYVESCRARDRALGLRALYPELDDWELEYFVERLDQDHADPAGHWHWPGLHLVRDDQHHVQGAIFFMATPGATLSVIPPKVEDQLPELVQRQARVLLLKQAVIGMTEARCQFAQLVIRPGELALDELHEAGFQLLADLDFLERELATHDGQTSPPAHIDFVPYDPSLEKVTIAMLEKTYVNSLDCPQLCKVRTPAQAFECHLSQADPECPCWRLVRADDQWVGCLLLHAAADSHALEIAYLGLIPDYRGRGLGRELLHEAFRMTRHFGFSCLSLAVDRGNRFARQLYDSHGFRFVGHRQAFWHVRDPKVLADKPLV